MDCSESSMGSICYTDEKYHYSMCGCNEDKDCKEGKICGLSSHTCQNIPTKETNCTDGVDDDRDGKVDCDDTDCKLNAACKSSVTKETNCTDKKDDDGDGKIDCDDTDCANDPACKIEEPANLCDGSSEDGEDCKTVNGVNYLYTCWAGQEITGQRIKCNGSKKGDKCLIDEDYNYHCGCKTDADCTNPEAPKCDKIWEVCEAGSTTPTPSTATTIKFAPMLSCDEYKKDTNVSNCTGDKLSAVVTYKNGVVVTLKVSAVSSGYANVKNGDYSIEISKLSGVTSANVTWQVGVGETNWPKNQLSIADDKAKKQEYTPNAQNKDLSASFTFGASATKLTLTHFGGGTGVVKIGAIEIK